MIIATEIDIRNESCTLYEIKCLIKHVQNSVKHNNILLRWKYKYGKYWGYAKYNGKILFEKEYSGITLLDAILEMQLDFNNFLACAPMKGLR